MVFCVYPLGIAFQIKTNVNYIVLMTKINITKCLISVYHICTISLLVNKLLHIPNIYVCRITAKTNIFEPTGYWWSGAQLL